MVSSKKLIPFLFASAFIAAPVSADESSAPRDRETRYHFGAFAAGSFGSGDMVRSPGASGTSTDTSFFWGASLGLERPFFQRMRIRLELEGTNERRFDFAIPGGAAGDEGHVEAWTFNANFWISYPLARVFPDTPIVNRLSPFGGGGVGFSRYTLEARESSASGRRQQTRFAWQGGFGVSLEITRWLSIDTRYQYADMGRVRVPLVDGGGTSQGTLEVDLGANEILGGLRFTY